jgi:L-glyceraldehyde 3-phosphate reductase
MSYRRVGRSGLKLPLLSLGLWQNFENNVAPDLRRSILRTAFDLGITHFDLANNYGTPYGSAERNFGAHLRQDFATYRDELVISTKAGYDMWPGPYGQGGSRKYLLASLDQSLLRMGLEYVDIFYSHRPDPDAPLEETADALVSAVQRGKALYVGVSNYSPEHTRAMSVLLSQRHVPLLIHQPRYNLLSRGAESGLLSTAKELGLGVIAFSPLAQGLLTTKYLEGIPDNSRVARGTRFLTPSHLTETVLSRTCALNLIASARGQSLAQMALAWVLRDAGVTSALIGASTPEQLQENIRALDNLAFSPQELIAIDNALAG